MAATTCPDGDGLLAELRAPDAQGEVARREASKLLHALHGCMPAICPSDEFRYSRCCIPTYIWLMLHVVHGTA